MFPLISEYIEAIKSAEDNFKELSYLKPVLDEDGSPIMTSGNFAVVFKMKDNRDGKFYALKCFTKEQEGRGEAYHQIAEELKDVESPYIISIRYLDKELFVDTDQTTETEFPVLLMDWVEGKTLDKYLCENLDDKFALEMLAYRFSQLAQWLIPQPFAHGDLKPDNIHVLEDGTLVLVDYDGMYVPAMKNQRARELGGPNFRHPLRTEKEFDEYIDIFPLISILLSIKAIALKPELLEKYGATDRLLFSERDYYDISKCELLKELFPSDNAEINNLISLFNLSIFDYAMSLFPVKLLNVQEPTNENNLCFDDWLDENRVNTVFVDNNGVHYSKDKKILIGAVDDWFFGEEYIIPEGTIEIKSAAFIRRSQQWYEPNYLKRIIIPSTVKIIGGSAIPGEYEIKCDSPHFKWYKNGLYTSDFKNLVYYPFIKETHEILLHPNTEKMSFGYGDYGEAAHPESCYQWQWHYFPTTVLYQCVPNVKFELSENTILCVPKGTKELFVNLGYDIKQIIEGCVFIDEYGVVYSENKKELLTFPFGCNLEYYRIIDTCETIRDNAFKKLMREAGYEDCYYIGNNLYTIILPDSLKIIGEKAFGRCDFLERIIIPSNVEEIGDNAFYGCSGLTSVTIPNSVTIIGADAFGNCSSLESIYIPNSVKQIYDFAFDGCFYLKSIIVDKRNLHYDSRDHSNAIIETKSNKLICGTLSTIIPDSVKIIGKNAFSCLEELKKMRIPHGVEIIEERAFYGCEKLSTITIPNSVVSIGKEAFWGCYEIKSITIPDSVKEIGDSVFQYCNSLTSVYLPESITNMGKDVFANCRSLCEIIIPERTLEKFKRLLPKNYHNLLVEEYGINDVPF